MLMECLCCHHDLLLAVQHQVVVMGLCTVEQLMEIPVLVVLVSWSGLFFCVFCLFALGGTQVWIMLMMTMLLLSLVSASKLTKLV